MHKIIYIVFAYILLLSGCSKTPLETCNSLDVEKLKAAINLNIENDLKVLDYLCDTNVKCILNENQKNSFQSNWDEIKNGAKVSYKLISSLGNSEQTTCNIQFNYRYPSANGEFYKDEEYKFRNLKINVWSKFNKQDISIENSSWYELHKSDVIQNWYCDSNQKNMNIEEMPLSLTISEYLSLRSKLKKQLLGINNTRPFMYYTKDDSGKELAAHCNKVISHFENYKK